MHYSTYLRITYWDKYRTDFPDNPFPTEAGLGKQKEPKCKEMDPLVNIVDSRRIVDTSGKPVKADTRKPDQTKAMGGVSARKVSTFCSFSSGTGRLTMVGDIRSP